LLSVPARDAVQALPGLKQATRVFDNGPANRSVGWTMTLAQLLSRSNIGAAFCGADRIVYLVAASIR